MVTASGPKAWRVNSGDISQVRKPWCLVVWLLPHNRVHNRSLSLKSIWDCFLLWAWRLLRRSHGALLPYAVWYKHCKRELRHNREWCSMQGSWIKPCRRGRVWCNTQTDHVESAKRPTIYSNLFHAYEAICIPTQLRPFHFWARGSSPV